MDNPSPTHGLIFEETAFTVVHRRSHYGPFDYEWADDLRGIEFTYRGEKFGEVCTPHQFYADLSPFSLPRRVSQVAMIVLGCLLISIQEGEVGAARRQRLKDNLTQFGCAGFECLEKR